MDSRSQVRQRDAIHLTQRDLNRRAVRQGFQILKNALYQIVVLSATIPSNIRQDNPVVVQYGLLVLYVLFSHTFFILQGIVMGIYMILADVCQGLFYCTLNTFTVYVKSLPVFHGHSSVLQCGL